MAVGPYCHQVPGSIRGAVDRLDEVVANQFNLKDLTVWRLGSMLGGAIVLNPHAAPLLTNLSLSLFAEAW